jgi:hypothetical protein
MKTPEINQDYTQKIKERFKYIMIDLLPADQLDAYIQNEVNAFFTDTDAKFTITEKTERVYSSNKIVREFGVSCSPFRLLIWQELNTLVMAKIRELTESNELKASIYSSIDDTGYVEYEEALGDRWEKKLEAHIQTLAKDMFRSMFTQAVMTAKEETVKEIQNHANQEHGGSWHQRT